MNKALAKIIIVVVAAVLIASCVGGAFALYTVDATDVVVHISATAPWSMTASNWYLVGTMNSWTPAEAYELVPDSTYQYKLESVTLTQGDEFKIRRGVVNDGSTDWKNVWGADYSSAVASGDIGYANDNTHVNTTGTYRVYIRSDWAVVIERIS